MENEWNKSNIGSIVTFMDEYRKKVTIAIYDVNVDVPRTVDFVLYSIRLTSEITQRGSAGIPENQEKQSIDDLEKPGDWVYNGKVSKDEKEQLERFSKTRRSLLDNF